MLYFALIASSGLLLLTNLSVRCRNQPVVGVVVLCGLTAVAASMTFFIIPVLLWQALLVFVAALIWTRTEKRPRQFLHLSLVATAIAYVIGGVGAVQKQMQYAEWRERFPFQSIEDRVPLAISQPSSINTGKYEELESRIEREQGWHYRSRPDRLAQLHEHAVDSFVRSWGFGYGRMPRRPLREPPSEYGLTNGLRTEPAPLQPSNPTYHSNSDQQITVFPTKEIQEFHDNAILDFLNPKAFGYVKDRQHVAGFQSHGFSKIPEGKVVEVVRLELVSLLIHKEPSVYLSDHMPQMDALKGVPTRPLDEFESEGLAALRKGEDLFVREDRMLGSIRSVKQCIACHGGERGQLLGAFTYTLRATK